MAAVSHHAASVVAREHCAARNGKRRTSCSRPASLGAFGISSVVGYGEAMGSQSFALKCITSPRDQDATRRRSGICQALMGEDPEYFDTDYIVLGIAHCFVKDDNAKLSDVFVVEAIPAGAVECMDNGGVTCYKHSTATNLGVALKQDLSLLPPEFSEAKFAEDFAFRTKCASRTWKRQHPQENLLTLVPENPAIRSDWNFNLEDKRILNMDYEVSDSDNIKQDLSIDVYGRQEDEEGGEVKEEDKAIQSLYNA